ncbi:MAG: hypothetical protein QM666_04865 [Acinetobacter sp.]
MKKYNILLVFAAYSICHAENISNHIPDNLRYQPPSTEQSKASAAWIKGSRPESISKLDRAMGLHGGQIYISYINKKATLDNLRDWNNDYALTQGKHDIRFIASLKTGYFSGNLSFQAEPQQHYQIVSQAMPKRGGLQFQFWIINQHTGQQVSEVLTLFPIGSRTSISYLPVIH